MKCYGEVKRLGVKVRESEWRKWRMEGVKGGREKGTEERKARINEGSIH